MKKSFLALSSLAIITMLGIGLSSCKDDPKPAKAKVSFASATKTVQESAGTIEVKVVLDRAVSSDIIVGYDLAGTATQKAGLIQGDYEVVGDVGQITIAKGETTGVIQLKIIDDLIFEADEVISISLTDVTGNEAMISPDNDATDVTIQSDDPAPKASFAASVLTVDESDGATGVLEIEVTLDEPVGAATNVQYELSGTAIDSLYGYSQQIPNEYYDYYIDGESGVIPIASGESAGKISIQLLSDFHYEGDETIILTLTASTGVQVGTTNKLTITVKQEDGKKISLFWDDASYTDVDMDMFLWIGTDVNSLTGVIAGSINPSTTVKHEDLFIPAAITGGSFGLSYVYYEGTASPLNFQVQFADFTSGVLEDLASRDVYNGSYTSPTNLNPWDTDAGTDPQVEQKFQIVSSAYTNVTSITTPGTGSRLKTYPIPARFKRGMR